MRPPGRSFLALLTLLTLPPPLFLVTLRTWQITVEPKEQGV